jgi:hypothetical protein
MGGEKTGEGREGKGRRKGGEAGRELAPKQKNLTPPMVASR